ncbi:TVP38/TMEM64 family protein [Pseudonocardia bannensis]|uniref:TVP38/TMEM64 family membrane protein n=1 Tax=Pseudonocardia bannensis TaxID=630973 RepID=A0A848DP23_9PSEU|nr:VTT domain-containing protein [Pseudonocardia bannensis]NMH94275.1 TVP38/TMEM64 family protein [Pseudonocardia bannensis]
MTWWRPVIAGIGTVLLLGVVVLVGRTHGVPGVGDLQATMAGAGLWAPALFVALQASMTIAPVPRTVFTLSAGLLFGSAVGLVLTLLATVLAALLAFWLVRVTGGRLVERYARGGVVEWVRRRLDHHGTLAVASLRLVPMVPFSVLNYLAGLSAVRFVPYVVGTVVGILPGTVAIVVLGDAVTGQPSPALIAVSAVCGLIGLTGVVAAARRPVPESAAGDVEPESGAR